MKLFDNKFGSLGLEDELCWALYQLSGRSQTAQALQLEDIHQAVVLLVQNIHLLVPFKALD